MNTVLLSQGFRLLLIGVLQVVIFDRLRLGPLGPYYPDIVVYPLVLLWLPFRTPRPLQYLLAFGLGLGLDITQLTPGLHAGAALTMMGFRPLVLRFLEPRAGYEALHSPTLRRFTIAWYAPYLLVLMLLYFLVYYSLEVFTPLYLGAILGKTMLSWSISALFLFLVTMIYNPLD